MKNLIHSKVVTICGGGSGVGRATFKPGPRPQRPTINELIYNAIYAISLGHDGKLSFIKNRYGENKKDLNPQEAIDILCDILARNLFNNRLDLFQEGVKAKLVEAIQEVIIREGSK